LFCFPGALLQVTSCVVDWLYYISLIIMMIFIRTKQKSNTIKHKEKAIK
jgi:hypothetical protein